ncbi:uncharacterized protein LOC8032421 [Ixodes scapularis]|uniref:uncharacterized protein LOC8032421 n=1 Tax=Ixodes scapularis TaxID=6945 RepID=UPI001AD79AB6|nr:uncharacterized protein LOC8032421 [Ixodes scapularis]
MRAAAFITILLAVSSMAIIPDGSVATAVFHGAPPSQTWARGSDTASKKRRHDAPSFDQIIVETLDQTATQRSSTTLILFLFSTGLLIGAVLLLLCILCMLRAGLLSAAGRSKRLPDQSFLSTIRPARAQIAYQPVKQQDAEDKFCVAEKRGASFAGAPIRKPLAVQGSADIRSLTFDQGTAGVTTQSSEDSETVRSRRSKKRRAKEKYARHRRSSHQNKEDEDEDENEDDDGMKTMSQLRLDLRFQQDKPKRTSYNAAKRYFEDDNTSSGSAEIAEPLTANQPAIASYKKTRPLVFCLNADDRGKKTSRNGSRPRGASDWFEKESQSARRRDKAAQSATLQSSQSSEIDEKFSGEKAPQVHRAFAYKPEVKPKPALREDPANGYGQAALKEGGVTLDHLKVLLDEILAEKNDGRKPAIKSHTVKSPR